MAAPRTSARSSTGPKLPSTPRPPATTIRASERSGRPLAAFSFRAVTRAAPAVASAGNSTVTGCGAVAAAACSGSTLFGLTVRTATGVVAFAVVV